LAREVKSISVFIQPCDRFNGKNVWDNCAIILSERSDDELYYCMFELLSWVRDMNWPGAECILRRLKVFQKNKPKTFATHLSICLKEAASLGDEQWEEVLREEFCETD